jgi:hypothetical protein
LVGSILSSVSAAAGHLEDSSKDAPPSLVESGVKSEYPQPRAMIGRSVSMALRNHQQEQYATMVCVHLQMNKHTIKRMKKRLMQATDHLQAVPQILPSVSAAAGHLEDSSKDAPPSLVESGVKSEFPQPKAMIGRSVSMVSRNQRHQH